MTGKPRSGVAKGGQGGRAGKAGSHRKGAAVGSGGQNKNRLAGKGPTPKAEERPHHPAARRARRRTRPRRPGSPSWWRRGPAGRVGRSGARPADRPVRGDRHGKAHLPPAENLRRQHTTHDAAQYVLGRHAAHLHALRHPRGDRRRRAFPWLIILVALLLGIVLSRTLTDYLYGGDQNHRGHATREASGVRDDRCCRHGGLRRPRGLVAGRSAAPDLTGVGGDRPRDRRGRAGRDGRERRSSGVISLSIQNCRLTCRAGPGLRRAARPGRSCWTSCSWCS